MSTNVQRESDMGANVLKRSHEDFSGDELTIDERGLAVGVKQQATETAVQPDTGAACSTHTASASHSPQMLDRDSPPPQSSPGSLTDAATDTPPRGSPSPNLTPTKTPSSPKLTTDAGSSSSSNPPAPNPTPSANQLAKRKRRTAAEKEAEEKDKAQKKKEREEKKEAKQAEKAKADAEKQARLDEKRRKKEEEERKVQGEKEKKERAQLKLMSFFKAPSTTPKKDAAATPNVKTESPAKPAATSTSSAAPTVKKEEKSEYEKRFRPFYIHSTVRLAKNPFEMDQETHDAKTRILREYFDGKRVQASVGKFDPVEVFQFPGRPAPRGRIHPPVRYTIEKMHKLKQKIESSSEEDNKATMKEVTDALRQVPIKTLRFYQDVRPPYRGTVTLKPYQAGKTSMRRLARNPTLRDQLPLNYEHDSEAEWESEGEDVDIEDDEEDDLDDGDGDMDEFLDDSEDRGPSRFVSANGLEPESTGLCWEDQKRAGPNRTLYEHRMEFILGKPYPISRSYSRVNTCFKESLDHRSGIDPFSTKYWEPEPKPKSVGRPTKDKAAAESSTPSNAFKAIGGTKAGVQSLPKKIMENNNLQELKDVIRANPKIAKGGLIDLSYVALAHAKISRNDIKEAIAAVAEKVGGKGHSASWTIKPGFDV
ncbi:Chromatin assembly factor 1 subunit rlf2 [Colletotrichum shisoi]|uniref:Chromatin assembly factor 1 subunit rlf2 n=1 Tax=Colletotrichum shisoi TaxID=2078593 RepID=A0A5Q4BAW3_9PEZI|nr:Chromatin assembly factor 1 subunit rlf2 [Colletotrichum shisoi]